LDINFTSGNSFRVNNEITTQIGKPFKNQYGSFVLTGKSNPATDYKVDWRSTSSRASVYVGDVSVSPKVTGTGILNVGMRSTNPHIAADIVNTLMQQYGEYTIAQKNRTSDQTLVFINDRLAELGQKLDSAQRVLLNYQQSNDL